METNTFGTHLVICAPSPQHTRIHTLKHTHTLTWALAVYVYRPFKPGSGWVPIAILAAMLSVPTPLLPPVEGDLLLFWEVGIWGDKLYGLLQQDVAGTAEAGGRGPGGAQDVEDGVYVLVAAGVVVGAASGVQMAH